MITTKLPSIDSGWKDKHLCPLAEELSSIRNQINSIGKQYGPFSSDLRISIYGQSVMFHVTSLNIVNDLTIEVVADNLLELESKFIDHLENYKRIKTAFDNILGNPLDALNEITIKNH